MNSRVQELEQLIHHHNDLYFNKSAPEVSDAEYDILVDELRDLDPQNPVLFSVGAPTAAGKIKHVSVMGSLNKCNTFEQIDNWRRAIDANRDSHIFVAPKIDGVAIELRYFGGALRQAVTRGDGEYGQDVTANALAMPCIPKQVAKHGDLRLRGEVFMPKSEFLKHGEGANPRNVASGKLTCHSPTVCGKAGLEFAVYEAFYSYDVDNVEGSRVGWATEKEMFRWLIDLIGFERVVSFVVVDNDSDLQWILDDWERRRPNIDFAIDGVVLTINDRTLQKKAGRIGNCPRYRIAYKFKPEQRPACVEDVIWQVGRTGKVTPVLKIKPTPIDGSVVTYISLHNWTQFSKLDLNVGDTVLIEKAGDIIPHIARKLHAPNPRVARQFHIDTCPLCNHDLSLDGAFIVCENQLCRGKLERRVLHYLRVNKVLGIGPAIVSVLCDKASVLDLPDLYTVTPGDLYRLFGTTTGRTIWQAILGTREMPLQRFLEALGIPGVGGTVSQQVAAKYGTLAAVRSTSISSFQTTGGLGRLTAERLYYGLDQALYNTIERLLQFVSVKDFVGSTGALTGLSFCLTGAMSKNRALIEQDVQNAGGTIKSCGAGLNFLVQADPASTSSKSQRAKQLGVAIISEETLYQMMGGAK